MRIGAGGEVKLVLEGGLREPSQSKLTKAEVKQLAGLAEGVAREMDALRFFRAGDELHISLIEHEGARAGGYWSIGFEEFEAALTGGEKPRAPKRRASSTAKPKPSRRRASAKR